MMKRAHIHTYLHALAGLYTRRLHRLCHLLCTQVGAPLFIFCTLLTLAACSTKVNTAGSRFWQKFNTKYNVFYNGKEAYKEGMQAKEKGAQDNYTDRLPLFMVGNAGEKKFYYRIHREHAAVKEVNFNVSKEVNTNYKKVSFNTLTPTAKTTAPPVSVRGHQE